MSKGRDLFGRLLHPAWFAVVCLQGGARRREEKEQGLGRWGLS